jgi:hypothetical protein
LSLTASFVVSLVIWLFVTMIGRSIHRLDISVEISGRRDFAVRLIAHSLKRPKLQTAVPSSGTARFFSGFRAQLSAPSRL